MDVPQQQLTTRDGRPIRIGDRAYHIGEDDGRVHAGRVGLERVAWPDDVPPRCQDDPEVAFVDLMLDDIVLLEPGAEPPPDAGPRRPVRTGFGVDKDR